MGQFSWLDCKDGSQILDEVKADVYVLIPEEFGGGHIHESYYDGYGNFGGYDIYDLVVAWNRKWIAENPDYHIPRSCIPFREFPWYPFLADEGNDFDDIVHRWEESDLGERRGWYKLRSIGVDIACYDDQNAAIRYPIKITHDPDAVYEQCEPSKGDPNQGWMDWDEED